MKIKSLITFVFLVIVLQIGAASLSVSGQSPTPQPSPTAPPQTQVAMSFAETLKDFTKEAIIARQLFINQVEKPLSGWFYALAQLLALIMFSWALAQAIITQGGLSPGDLTRMGLRCAVGFLLLFFAGDVDGDGARGDLINYPASVGYYYAYGVSKNGTVEGSFLHKQETDQETKFNQQYQRFVENKLMVGVKNNDIPVRYPTTKDLNLLAALYTGKPMNQAEIDEAKSREWTMSMLYGTLNFSRGVLSFADFFLFFISGFAVLVLRLALPLMIGAGFHKEYGQKMTSGFFWTAFVWTIIFPGMCQVIRLVAYSAGNVALGLGGANPYYTWDATTGKIVSSGNPEAIVVICSLYMLFAGLCLFAAFFLSMYLSQGKILEGIISTTSAWFTAAASVGVGVATGAYATRLSTEADRVGAKANQDATMVEAGFSQQASQISAKAGNEASKILADQGANAQKTQAVYSKNAEDLMTHSNYENTALSAYAGYVDKIANSNIEAGQSRATALMNYKQDWMGLDSREKQERLGNALDLSVKNNDAYAREIQQSIKDYPEAKELIGKEVDNYLNGVPVVGSALKTVGINGDAFNSWLNSPGGKAMLGGAVGNSFLQNVDSTNGLNGIFGDASISKAQQQDMLNAENNVNFGNQTQVSPTQQMSVPKNMTGTQKQNLARFNSLMKSDPNFLPAMQKMCARNGWNSDELLNLMALETAGTFDKSIRGGDNNNFAGLIQFGPEARKDLNSRFGTPTDVVGFQKHLKSISATDQLKYVESYFKGTEKGAGVKLNTPGSLYAAVAAGSGNMQNAKKTGILFSATSSNGRNRAGYNANKKSWDVNKDGVIQQGELYTASSSKLGAGTFFSASKTFGTLQNVNIPQSKVLSAQYARQVERDFALKQNQMTFEGKENIAAQYYREQRNMATEKFGESIKIADKVQDMRTGAAGVNYNYTMQGAEMVREGSLQASNIRQAGSFKSAEITQGGQFQAADINRDAALKSAELAYEGRREASKIQFDAALESSHLRAMSQMFQNVGSSAGHQIAEASEKFSRL